MYAGADGDAVPEEFREARNKGLYYLQFSGKQKMKCARSWRNRGFRQPLLKMRFFFLKHYRYLDDEDYARRYVEKNDHKKSIRQMKFDLRQKGVSDDLVEMVFEDMEVDESARSSDFEKEKITTRKNRSRETPEDLRISGAKRFFLRRDQQCDEAVGIGLFPAPKDRMMTGFVGMHRSTRNEALYLT